MAGPKKRTTKYTNYRSEADFENTKRSNYFPDQHSLGKKGNIDNSEFVKNSNRPSSSAMPTGAKDMIGRNGSVENEPSRQRRLGKDVTTSGPKSRDFPFFKHTVIDKKKK